MNCHVDDRSLPIRWYDKELLKFLGIFKNPADIIMPIQMELRKNSTSFRIILGLEKPGV